MEIEATWKTLAARLKEAASRYKETAQKTDVDIATEMGVDRSSLNHWLNARRTPKITEFLDLCKILNISPVELLAPSYRSPQESRGATALAHRISSLAPDRQKKLEDYLTEQEQLQALDKQTQPKNKPIAA